MQMVLTREQLSNVIRLARAYRVSNETDAAKFRSYSELLTEMMYGRYVNPDYNALLEYLYGMEYGAVLDIEALMDYGGEVIGYSEDGDSLAVCYDYIQTMYSNGSQELAINYIVGKLNLAERLEAAMDAIQFTDDGKIVF